MKTSADARPGADYADWIGRTETREDLIAPSRVAALAATLDDPRQLGAGDPLPPLWHWIFFPDHAASAALGADGHARRGGFLPPVSAPHRMWAGGRLDFLAPLPIGGPATRRSTLVRVDPKTGRSGPLVFITIEHQIMGANGQLAVRETHDIVFRSGHRVAGSAVPAPGSPVAEQREVRPSIVQLFRYSALTFNAHRIHYDRDFATQTEGYPGLVVHGPLLATWLMALGTDHGRFSPTRFEFRAVAPLFDTAPLRLCRGERNGATVPLWATDFAGGLAMQAQLTL